MYLKRLEIAGFKSFADRTIIEFNQGLTAVVGPNGSGKSNITEAIRWVLGEQSAKNLRGGKMPDVIFAGSSSRSPLNVAEVTLILDNTEKTLPIDYSEVSVMRRLTRSGESDFFINKQPCRLKDIVNLFMDSGLGRESFSIISQGKVEAIFNSKPEDRRGIFEEAAGVLKYKTRKKEAKRKLVETDDNLSRVKDIIFELETQKEPLFEQSERAKRHLLLKEQLKEVDLRVTIEKMTRLKVEYDEKKAKLADINQTVAAEQQTITTVERDLVNYRGKRDELDHSLEILQTELLKVTQSYERLEGQKKVNEERQKHSVHTADQYEQQSADLRTNIEVIQQELLELKANLSQKRKSKRELTHEIDALTKELEFLNRSSKEKADDLRSDYIDIMQQQTNIKNDLKHLEKQYQQETQRNKKDLDAYDQLLQQDKEIEQRKTQLEKEQTNHENVLQHLTEGYQTTQTEFQELRQTIQMTERQMYDALKILQQAQAKEKSLRELQENYAGFYQGVRAVLKEKQQMNGIIGAVAELVTVPAEVSLAIETALGAAAQHIVVADEQSARSGITFLKQKRAGRATFLPLTTVKPRVIAENVRETAKQLPGFVGIASELVTCDPTIQSIIQNLLGLTVIARDLASANQLSKELNYKYRIVSLEGDVMNPGGSMTGGATKRGQGANLFNQHHELQVLEKQIADMTMLYQRKEQDVALKKQTATELEERLETLRRDGEQARLTEQSINNELQQLVQKQKQQAKERRVFDYETQELQRFLEVYQEEKEQLEEVYAATENKRQLLDKLMNQTEQEISDNTQKRDNTAQQLSEKQSEAAVLMEQIKQIAERTNEKEDWLLDAEKSLEQFEQRLNSESTEQTSQETLNHQLKEEMQQLKQTREQLMTDVETKRNDREVIHQSIVSFDQTLVSRNKELQMTLDKKANVEVAKKQADLSLERLSLYLFEEYGTNYDSAKINVTKIIDFSADELEIERLKRELKNLGPINSQAITQYDELVERYNFLATQRDDLLQAKDALLDTMSEMDQLVIEKFHDVFSDIRHEFQTVFPNMFGGGHADLTLTDPSDLLNTGVDIVAQPPGKKLQQLSLLSGGERALTAIALLFAIIQARPVPFCILDEVEAALDDANVARYGNYLRHFGDSSQFIVITHRKGTMEAADDLYGVTMQESGVSKIVSVHLEDFKDDPAIK
ncbi:chromosome segregation protein SMC [Vagococcus vulneris]|uniref:Chromosome partition protein Smc n=1 Tax=Vagococcus vulneris TaxID=1977869 RepID=A0A429ZXD2_9ENTE|nr:chromosome segregation protein SMC [Vagococcus vulneris]RST98551.1 chromosome segregation protein SMC [Vagococcus vulneris]